MKTPFIFLRKNDAGEWRADCVKCGVWATIQPDREPVGEAMQIHAAECDGEWGEIVG